MNGFDSRIGEVITLLEGVVDESFDADAAIARWPNFDGFEINRKTTKILNHAWEQLNHYIHDEDIRDREPKYGERQRQRLSRKVEELKALRKQMGRV